MFQKMFLAVVLTAGTLGGLAVTTPSAEAAAPAKIRYVQRHGSCRGRHFKGNRHARYRHRHACRVGRHRGHRYAHRANRRWQ